MMMSYQDIATTWLRGPSAFTPDPPASPAPTPDPSASAILREAADIVAGDRNQTHGGKERSFTMIASMWTVLFGFPVTARQVAMALVLMKICRAICGKPVRDHFVDMAGYSGIAGEL